MKAEEPALVKAKARSASGLHNSGSVFDSIHTGLKPAVNEGVEF
jgi:hypothetical protein